MHYDSTLQYYKAIWCSKALCCDPLMLGWVAVSILQQEFPVLNILKSAVPNEGTSSTWWHILYGAKVHSHPSMLVVAQLPPTNFRDNTVVVFVPSVRGVLATCYGTVTRSCLTVTGSLCMCMHSSSWTIESLDLKVKGRGHKVKSLSMEWLLLVTGCRRCIHMGCFLFKRKQGSPDWTI